MAADRPGRLPGERRKHCDGADDVRGPDGAPPLVTQFLNWELYRSEVLDLRVTTPQKCVAFPRRART